MTTLSKFNGGPYSRLYVLIAQTLLLPEREYVSIIYIIVNVIQLPVYFICHNNRDYTSWF